MLTLAHARTLSSHALDWTSKDIQGALDNIRLFIDTGTPYDEKRASEYADELAILAQVRNERKAHKTCTTCGQRIA